MIGRGLTRDRVLALAGAVRQSSRPSVDEALLPAGLRALGSLPGAAGSVVTRPWAQRLTVRVGDTDAHLAIWTGDPRLYAHLAFWGTSGPPLVRRAGWHGVVDRGDQVVVIDTSDPISPDDAQALVAAARSLVPGDDAAVERALDDVAGRMEPVPATRNLCGSAPGTWVTLSGVADRTVWAVTLSASAGSYWTCERLTTADGRDLDSAGGGPSSPTAPDEIRFTSGHTSVGGGPSFHVVHGDVPAAAVRVKVESGGNAVDALLADRGPEPGRRWFAIAIIEATPMSKAQVTAYDAAGSVVASGTSS